MMAQIIKTELWKLKRYHVLWAGVLLMLLSVVLTLFTSTANDGSLWTFSFFAEQVIKNNTTTIFPVCITLIAGYMISRKETNDTLKSIITIPVAYRNLLCGKLIVCGGLSLCLESPAQSLLQWEKCWYGFLVLHLRRCSKRPSRLL